MTDQLRQAESGVLAWIDRDITGPMRDFQDPHQEWRRLFSELYGTFLLVIVAAGGGLIPAIIPGANPPIPDRRHRRLQLSRMP